MAEKGKVVSLKNDGKIAVVSFMRTEACANCKRCTAGFQTSEMLMEIPNSRDARQGNTVYVEIPENGFFTAALIMYVVPLILMVAGFFAGYHFAPSIGMKPDLAALACGMLMLAVSFFIIRANEKHFKQLKIFAPSIVKVEA